jgi:threonine dehydrogenase-like Zn-dependent dehydrogenase
VLGGVGGAGGAVLRKLHDHTGGGADRAVECAGDAAAGDLAIRCLAPGGRAVLVGGSRRPATTVSGHEILDRELEVVGSSGAPTQDIGELFDLLDDERLDLSRSVTDTIALADVPDALRALAAGEVHGVRTVVTEL